MKVTVRERPRARAEPKEKRSLVWLTDSASYDTLECQGYTRLSHNPEVRTAIDTIARLIGAMTIHLMQNTERGDIRVINGLSNVVDITPNKYMTRANFVRWIVKTMLLDGDGNAVVYPKTRAGYLQEMIPIPAAFTSFITDGEWGYKVVIAGKEYKPDRVLHFVANPGD